MSGQSVQVLSPTTDEDADILAPELGTTLPNGWRTAQLSEVARYVNGYGFAPSDWTAHGKPIIRIQNLNDPSKPYNHFAGEIDGRYRVHRGDVLISWSASLGAYLWDGPDAWLNQHIFKAIVNEHVADRDFFYWAMKHTMERIVGMTHGSTMHHVTQKVFLSVAIPLPPIHEQHAIARVLRAVHDAIQARRRELELERERKAALMQHLFTKGTRGESTKQTEIGEMPESWEVVQLGTVCRNPPQNGAFVKNPRWGTGVPFVNVVDVYPRVSVDVGAVQRLQCDGSVLATYALHPGDLLFVRSSLKREGVGQCCYVGEHDEPVIYDCHLIRVSPEATYADPLCMAYYFQTSGARSDLVARSKTTTMTTMNQKALSLTSVPLPPLDEQRLISTTLRTCDLGMDALTHEVAVYEELFRALLEELMTGRLSALPLVDTVGA